MATIEPVYDPKATSLPVLRYLVAVAEHRHFGRAAAACGVSQPTLSAQLAGWERRMGVNVFERGPRGALPTPDGERVVAAARSALAALRAVEEAAGSGAGPLHGPVRLGVIPTVAPDALPWLARGLERELPGLHMPVREATTAELGALLDAGGIDVALLALLPGMDGMPLWHEPFVAALPRGHRLASRKELDAADLAGDDLLLLEEGHCLRGQALALCGSRGAAAGAYRATSLPTLIRLVGAGLGITVLPALSAQNAGGDVVCRPLAGEPTRTIALRWRSADPRAEDYRRLGLAMRKAAPRPPLRLA